MRFLFFVVVCIGCNSLPVEITEHSCETSKSCIDAAEKIEGALRALKYKQVTLCFGTPFPGAQYHSWVEYTENKTIYILDPGFLTGVCRIDKTTIPKNWFVATHRIQHKFR